MLKAEWGDALAWFEEAVGAVAPVVPDERMGAKWTCGSWWWFIC